MKLVDQYGQPLESRSVQEPLQTAHLTALQRELAGHPARGITPSKLNGLLVAAEEGDLIAQHELFADMEERDGHLYSEIGKRKRAVTKLDWSIEPPRNASREELDACAFVQELVGDMPDLEDVIYDALDGILHGFSAQEMEWANDAGLWLVRRMHHRPQSWFTLDAATRTQLRLRTQEPDGEALKPFVWLLHTHKAKSGYISRSGLGRVLVWPYIYKHYSVGDLAEFLDICGVPMRIGRYPSNATESERTALWRAVAGLGHSAAGIIPQSMSIDFEQAAQGSEKPFEAMIRWAERTQTKAIIGNMPTNDNGAGGGIGSGLAELANEVRKEIRDSDAKQLADTLTQQLIYPLLALNKGWRDVRRCPRFSFDIVEAEDIKMMAESLPKLVNMGMQIPVEWAHEKLRIPQADDKQIALGAPLDAALPKEKAKHAARLTALAHLAALPAASHKPAPTQELLDAAIAQVSEGLQPQVARWLAPALQALGQAGTAEAALELLAQENLLVNDATLIEALAQAMFVAELLGADEVQGEL